jgi:RNA polymerase subunit RPABC4/transcription elongation factor Spt4
MDIFEKISNVTKSVVDKTSNKVSTVRLNAKVKSLKSSIDVQKQRIGDFYWLQHREDESFDPTLAEEFKQIAEYFEQIAALEKEIQRLVEKAKSFSAEKNEPNYAGAALICPSCGAANTSDTKFCASCGIAFIPAPEPSTCSNCGAVVNAEMKFCAVCGSKLKSDDETD